MDGIIDEPAKALSSEEGGSPGRALVLAKVNKIPNALVLLQKVIHQRSSLPVRYRAKLAFLLGRTSILNSSLETVRYLCLSFSASCV